MLTAFMLKSALCALEFSETCVLTQYSMNSSSKRGHGRLQLVNARIFYSERENGGVICA